MDITCGPGTLITNCKPNVSFGTRDFGHFQPQGLARLTHYTPCFLRRRETLRSRRHWQQARFHFAGGSRANSSVDVHVHLRLHLHVPGPGDGIMGVHSLCHPPT